MSGTSDKMFQNLVSLAESGDAFTARFLLKEAKFHLENNIPMEETLKNYLVDRIGAVLDSKQKEVKAVFYLNRPKHRPQNKRRDQGIAIQFLLKTKNGIGDKAAVIDLAKDYGLARKTIRGIVSLHLKDAESLLTSLADAWGCDVKDVQYEPIHTRRNK